MTVAGVLPDGASAGVAGAAPCHSLTHLARYLTMAVELEHEGSTGGLHCCPQGDLHTRLRTADRVSCETPLCVVETSSDAGLGRIAQVTTLWASRSAAMKAQSLEFVLVVHYVVADPGWREFFGFRCGT